MEKVLKAWLSLLGVTYPRTHVLYDLFALLEAHGAVTISGFHHLQSLTPFGVQFRYEEYSSLDEPLDRSEVIRHVNALLTHGETLIREAEQEA